ncbi:MAG: hypothetical protein JWN23_987 [Rhodocyclales bacterium]|nr:hypothetical protein [Rhodocyclales bacterium]
MLIRDHQPKGRYAQGFAYLFLLFAMVVIGLLLAAFGQNWSTTTQREREAELLFIGQQFSAALTSYRKQTPAGRPDKPATLQELVEDDRFPFPVRHLRQIFRDPMTGKRDWDVQLANGRIVSIRSRSEKRALRHTLPVYISISADTKESPTYHDWQFVAPQDQPGNGAVAAPGAQAN